jgi:hypothetical protein
MQQYFMFHQHLLHYCMVQQHLQQLVCTIYSSYNNRIIFNSTPNNKSVLWNHNDLLRFRIRLLFWFQIQTILSTVFQKFVQNLKFLLLEAAMFLRISEIGLSFRFLNPIFTFVSHFMLDPDLGSAQARSSGSDSTTLQ